MGKLFALAMAALMATPIAYGEESSDGANRFIEEVVVVAPARKDRVVRRDTIDHCAKRRAARKS